MLCYECRYNANPIPVDDTEKIGKMFEVPVRKYRSEIIFNKKNFSKQLSRIDVVFSEAYFEVEKGGKTVKIPY